MTETADDDAAGFTQDGIVPVVPWLLYGSDIYLVFPDFWEECKTAFT